MEKEVYKSIEGYEGSYEVSNFGNVRSLDRVIIDKNGAKRNIKGKLLALSNAGKIQKDGSSYLKVGLSKNRVIKQFLAHRLVAQAFVDNPNNYEEVNHKDEDKHNNIYSNLEWCTRSENNNHSQITQKLNKAKMIKINQLDMKGNFIKEWPGMRAAARGLGGKTHKHIALCCKGEKMWAYGFKWEYAE